MDKLCGFGSVVVVLRCCQDRSTSIGGKKKGTGCGKLATMAPRGIAIDVFIRRLVTSVSSMDLSQSYV